MKLADAALLAVAEIEDSQLGEIEANILHGIVPPIASPQFQIMNGRRRRYQCTSQFNAVALTELSQIFPSLPSNLQVDGHTLNRCKKRIQNLLLGLTRTVPELGDRNRRAQEGGISPAQIVPFRENRLVFGTRDFS